MNPADVQLIEQIRQATQGASRLLCTLARRGKALERDQSHRAAFLLATVRTHPLYKGGRLAFDMLEVEDLMLDGAPLDSMSSRELVQVFNAGTDRLAETLIRMGSRTRDGRAPLPCADESLTSSMPHVSLGPADSMAIPTEEPAPGGEQRAAKQSELELQAADYLYDYVVLGLLDVLGGTRASQS